MEELTDKQIAQQDLVDNCIEELLAALVPPWEHDIEKIGALRDEIGHLMMKIFGITEEEYYPSVAPCKTG